MSAPSRQAARSANCRRPATPTDARPHLAGDEVQEGQALKALGLLVAELHNAKVALAQRLNAQPVPGVALIKSLGVAAALSNFVRTHEGVSWALTFDEAASRLQA